MTDNVLDGYDLTSGLDELSVTAISGSNVTDVDFGYVDEERTAAITSGVWIDADGDGLRGPDETPISGVDGQLAGLR